ncbi:FAD-binding domain-containing protein [Xylariomycetidae sp. FL2044]|nr:FAD-binding domain-containing protein [Xylariomycetidae sp. FL2044]
MKPLHTPSSVLPLALLLLLLSVQSTHATPTPSTLAACNEIAAALPDQVSFPLSLAYLTAQSEYWSAALKEVQPACIVEPASAKQVSVAVAVLNRYADVEFAVKSGGHDPNPGHATVEDGVLITMRGMVSTTLDEATGIASVLPGGTWDDVIGDLEPHGVTVVGGRLGIVGVGGYLLQAGLSFLSAQYGLAVDSIVGWETVLANGSVVNVDVASRPDLAVAMKGSGSQFGIVTKFQVQTHPIGQVWGGSRTYDASKGEELMSALHNFVAPESADPKAAVIHTTLLLQGGTTLYNLFYFYDGPEVPADSPLAEYLDILPLVDSTSTQTYASLLYANGQAGELAQGRQSFRTYTIPYIPSNPAIYAETRDQWSSILAPHLSNPLNVGSQCSIDFQPFPSTIGAASDAAGGNAMGISGSDPDRLLLELQCMWASGTDDAEIYAMSREMTAWLDGMVPEWLAEAGLDADAWYLPLFMNDAQGDQNVTGTYRDYAKFKTLQEEVDPLGFFSERAGGFKY